MEPSSDGIMDRTGFISQVSLERISIQPFVSLEWGGQVGLHTSKIVLAWRKLTERTG